MEEAGVSDQKLIPDTENKLEIPNENIFSCGICYIDYNLEAKETQIKFLEKCGHKFCSECFGECFRALVEDQGKSHLLKCPEVGCGQMPTEEEVKDMLENDCFEKYVKFNNNLRVAINKNLYFCPTPNCEEVHDIKLAKKNINLCSKCKKKACSKCKRPYHGNNSCSKHNDAQQDKWAGQIKIHVCP
jgi:ariadne-1